ncbi:MAG: hypothetical protein LBS20_09510 [Prevotella sp.]|jgi:hypothetical protein|nr:hypothetical protein [Prevotella sp.]
MQIQQVISDFRIKQQQLSAMTNKVLRGEYKKTKKLPPIEIPCILSDLLCPVVKELMTELPEINIAPDNAANLYARGGYYRIFNKEKLTIGRFSYKLGKSVRVYYANAKGNVYGKDKKFNSLPGLIAIIKK